MLDLRLEYTTDRLEKTKFIGDYSDYQQVLLNVMSNAVKFSPVGGKINVQISYDVMENKNKYHYFGDAGQVNSGILSVIVRDEGQGIDASDMDKLFKPFSTLQNSNKINPNGVGIGLFISKLLCEKSGGDISCFSDGLGCGATFEFRLFK